MKAQRSLSMCFFFFIWTVCRQMNDWMNAQSTEKTKKKKIAKALIKERFNDMDGFSFLFFIWFRLQLVSSKIYCKESLKITQLLRWCTVFFEHYMKSYYKTLSLNRFHHSKWANNFYHFLKFIHFVYFVVWY